MPDQIFPISANLLLSASGAAKLKQAGLKSCFRILIAICANLNRVCFHVLNEPNNRKEGMFSNFDDSDH